MFRRSSSIIRTRRLVAETLEPRRVLASGTGIDADPSLTNTAFVFESEDVNRDRDISPIDVLMVINSLNDSAVMPTESHFHDDRPEDVDFDGQITPTDALMVINHLNRNAASSETATASVAPASSAIALNHNASQSEYWALSNFVFGRQLSVADDSNVFLGSAFDGRNEWEVKTNSNGTTLRNTFSGDFLATANWKAFTTAEAGANAYWNILTHSDGTISLQNIVSQRYLDGDGSYDDFDVNESLFISSDDKWSVEKRPMVESELVWTLTNRAVVDRDLHVGANDNADLAPIGSEGTEWEVGTDSNGITFRNVQSGKYLAAANWNAFATDSLSENTYWEIVFNSDRSIGLQNKATGRYLDGDGAGEDWDVDESVALLHDDGWFVTVVAPSSTVPEVWSLANRHYSERSLHAASDGNADLVPTGSSRTAWEVTTIAGSTTFKSVESGDYLAANNWNAFTTSNAASDDILWNIVTNADGSISLQNVATGRFLDGDGADDNWNVDESLEILHDDGWFVTILDSPTNSDVSFAMIGDYGYRGPSQLAVAAQVLGANPDFIVGAGDARYFARDYDNGNGVYCDYISGAVGGQYCPSGGNSPINRFFPAAGNHDYSDGNGISEYTEYFDLPGANVPSLNESGSELYYDVIQGSVHIFVLDSEAIRNDSSSYAAQRTWLQAGLASSETAWQVVVLHHSPYSSSNVHGSDPIVQLPFADWGVDLVMSGHDHLYERIVRNGTTFVVNGLGGGANRYEFGEPIEGSEFRFQDDFGAVLIEATETSLSGSFIDIQGTVHDRFTVPASETAAAVFADPNLIFETSLVTSANAP